MTISDHKALAWLELEAPGAASTCLYKEASLWWSPSSGTKEVLHPFPHTATLSACRSLLSQTSVSLCMNSVEVHVLPYSEVAELLCCTSAGFHGELIPDSLI